MKWLKFLSYLESTVKGWDGAWVMLSKLKPMFEQKKKKKALKKVLLLAGLGWAGHSTVIV